MATLHKIEEVKVYCGPAAIMAITGFRLPAVRSAINKVLGRRDNQGVCRLNHKDLEGAMQLCGVAFIKSEVNNIRLSEYVKMLKPNTRYIINITGHYITYLNGLVIDNHTRFGTHIDECKWRLKYVKRAYEIIEGA